MKDRPFKRMSAQEREDRIERAYRILAQASTYGKPPEASEPTEPTDEQEPDGGDG